MFFLLNAGHFAEYVVLSAKSLIVKNPKMIKIKFLPRPILYAGFINVLRSRIDLLCRSNYSWETWLVYTNIIRIQINSQIMQIKQITRVINNHEILRLYRYIELSINTQIIQSTSCHSFIDFYTTTTTKHSFQ